MHSLIAHFTPLSMHFALYKIAFYTMKHTLMRTAGTLMAALFLIGNSLSAQTTDNELLQRADKQYNLYAYNLALKTYQDALRNDPNNAYILGRIGDCHYQLNRPQEALSWYDKASASSTASAQTYMQYGRALMQTGDYVGAKKWFQYANQGGNAVTANHFVSMAEYALAASGKEALYQVRNEPGINTDAADYLPAFQGDAVVFSSARNDKKRNTPGKSAQDWSGSSNNQLFTARRNTNGMLHNLEFLRSDLENMYNEGPVSFSANGQRVAFCRNNFIDGARQVAERGVNLSLYTGEVKNGQWTNVRPFPYNGSDYGTGFPCLSADGNTLWFASNDPNGSAGGWDIYVTTWENGNWTLPRNMGTPVNTPGNEVTPFMDGVNLYFASDWHKGFGGLDVFRTDLVNGVPTDVYHLGPGINSSRDDYGFIFDSRENIGYFTSNRPDGGSKGKEDIWQVRKRADEFVISVTDERQFPLAGAQIDFSACGAGTKQTDQTGKYAFNVTSGKADCYVTVRKEGYSAATAAINSRGTKYVSLVLQNLSAPAATTPSTTSAPVATTKPAEYSTPSTATPVASREEYIIYVVDGANSPVANAEIDFSECSAGTKYSDAAGRYGFAVNGPLNCSITVRKGGYVSTLLTIRPSSSRTLTAILLDTRGFGEPVASSDNTIQVDRPATYSTNSSNKPAVVSTTTPMASDMELISEQQLSPSKHTAINTDGSVETLSGYAVQIATSPTKFTPKMLEKYDDLNRYGNLYSKLEAKAFKLRLGVYATQTDAERVQKQIKDKHKGAFVTAEKNADARLAVKVEAIDDNRPAQYSTGTGKGKPADLKVISAVEAAKPAEPTLHFSIEVGTYTADQPSALNKYGSLMAYGNLFTVVENGLNRVRLGVWNKYESAAAALQQVVANGYPQATVVTQKADKDTERLLLAGVSNAPTAPVAETKVSAAAPAPTVYSTTPAPTKKPAPKGKATEPEKTADKPVVYSTPTTVTPVPVEAAPKPVPYATSAAKLDKEPGRYFVRLVSVTTDPRMFDAKKAEKAGGKVESRPSPNGATVFLLGGFGDLTATAAACERAIQLGYKDAYVVKETEDMVLRRVQF